MIRLRTIPPFALALALALLVPAAATASAQVAAQATPAKAPTMVAPAKAIDAMLTAYENELTGLAKAMPADKYSFAPSSAVFAAGAPAKFEGVRTFAQQMTHLAQANYGIYGFAFGIKPDVDMKSFATMTDKDAILKSLADSFVFAHKAVATLTRENFFESVRGDQTRGELAAYAVARGYDHYGQSVEYLRMNGIVPPSSDGKPAANPAKKM